MNDSVTRKSPRVVDFSTHFSGPLASRQMIQLGADVVKIEAPGHGDGNRGTPPIIDGEGALHPFMNTGTRSLVAHARSEGWADLVAAAARWADVVIVGNRPASARKLGLDFESIRQHRPDVVYCQITGYGLDGPWSSRPAHGLQLDALAGVLQTGWEGGRPVPPQAYRTIGTTLAGVEAALGIYAGLHQRSLGHGAQYVHVSVWESALAWMWRDTTTFAVAGHQWEDYADLGSRYRMYRTSDDRALLVCPIERPFWERFCDIVGMPAEARTRGDWSQGMDYGRGNEAESEEIAERLATRTLTEWEKLLDAADIPMAPVLTWSESLQSDHAAANGVTGTIEYRGRDLHVPTTPVSVSSVPLGVMSRQVVDPADGCATDCGVDPVVIVEVEPVGKCFSAGVF